MGIWKNVGVALKDFTPVITVPQLSSGMTHILSFYFHLCDNTAVSVQCEQSADEIFT